MPLPVRAYDRSLNAEIERLLYQAEVVTQEAVGIIADLQPDRWNWRPAPETWSIAQNFAHLNIVNEQFLKHLEVGIRQGRADGKLSDGPYSYSMISRWMLRIVQPPVKRRFQAPKKFQPPQAMDPAALMSRWHDTHKKLVDLMRDANGLDLAAIKVTSAVSSLLKYNLGAAFWIMTAHDRRHLHQAREVRNHPNFPKAA